VTIGKGDRGRPIPRLHHIGEIFIEGFFLIDFEKGELLDDERIKSDFAKQNSYQDWLDEQTIHLSELHCENEAHGFYPETLIHPGSRNSVTRGNSINCRVSVL
jgi:hypothetical protein